jgi:ABC-type antimicrobial peptide transport system permease subunit
MIKNYFKIALRNIRRYSTYSILNISGMAIGMAIAILLFLFAQNELSYDRFYKNADNIYRVLEKHYEGDGKIQQRALTSYPLATALKEKYPEIILSSRYHNFWQTFTKGDDYVQGTLAPVDKDFFEMFDIVFVHGDETSALNGPNDIVLTEDMAARYYGKEDPMGKKMTLPPDHVFTVTGVIKNVPRNSFFYIDCLVSSEFLKFQGDLNNWENITNYTFIELKRGTDSKFVEEKIKFIIQDNLTKAKEAKAEVFLQELTKIHLYSHGKYALDIGAGNIAYVRLAVLMAILILTIACINFMNLFTAQSSRRAKEIGLRKVAGANRRIIIFQFLCESLLIILIAHVIAMILVELLLPGFNSLVPSKLKLSYGSAGLYSGLMTIVLFCAFLAGGYPAMYMSSFEPINIMKGINRSSGNAKIRRSLVVLQFTLSFLFIISTLIVGAQLKYLQNKNLGLDIANVCRFSFSDINQGSFKRDLGNNPDILGVSMTSDNTISFWNSTPDFSWEGKQEADKVMFSIFSTDENYLQTFKPEIIKGRFFSSDLTTNNNTLVINERAAKLLGFKDPIGKQLSYHGANYLIVGVLKDFHFQSLHSRIEPLVIMYMPLSATNGLCNVRMKPDKITSTLTYIRETYKSYNPKHPPSIGFLYDDYKLQYFLEQIINSVLVFITFLTIIISCLGIFGLSTFMTVSRTKEIGIRKVNGAKSNQIFFMLSKEYFTLVGISSIIASPIAWFATNMWLQSFAYHLNLNLGLFVVAWIIVMALTLVTVGLQSYRAASKNPVEALRYE